MPLKTHLNHISINTQLSTPESKSNINWSKISDQFNTKMKLKLPHHTTISLILQRLALRHLLNLSATISKLRKIDLFRTLLLLASSTRNPDKSTLKLEYQFSVSSTPLIHRYNYKRNGKQYVLRRLCAILCPCIYVKAGSSRWDDEDSSMNYVTERDRILMLTSYEQCDDNVNKVNESCDYIDGFDDCVDEKAERFIARFYEEMRKQRRESSGGSSAVSGSGAVIELL